MVNFDIVGHFLGKYININLEELQNAKLQKSAIE